MRVLPLLCLLFSSSVWAKLPVFVSADWVQEHQENIKLIDLSSRDQFQKYHLPNAIWVNYAWLIKPQNGLQLSGGPDYMAKVLSQLGITPKDQVILYDNQGNLDASRLYWELKKLNHENVALLDGGSVQWVLKGYPVTQKMPKITPANYPTPSTSSTDRLTANKQEVMAAIQNKQVALLDTRTKEEYLGSSKEKRTGHIPGAQLFPWQAAVDFRNGYQQRSAQQLTAFLEQVGITDKNQQIILYCNTAHRAARLFPMLQSLGFEQVRLYDGSTQEWSQDKSLPLTTGAIQ
ncbi:Thiosulfate sulfurtransferase [Hydrogenovibrio crunogenus]|uniref:Thiosulfate sulfurtransferase n=1 Tax=Hydrogenovibrio crunogenus TaxID=39765 RepID=A0A4P7NZ72_9GAMM|nr:sulfurtransferase [Hydrogenovibrio crunogenus]QBZ82988.1 Thiosulfate sulfurtransferase [Hydrogenovibrio crunogenus]